MGSHRGVRRAASLLLLAFAAVLAAAASASAAPPSNDSFASPTPITLGTTVQATNVEATKESGEPNHAGNAGGHSVWFSWTAPRTETVGLSTPCGILGQGFVPLVAVYTGSAVNALTPVANNATIPAGSCGPFTEQSEVEFEAQSGVEYRIAVDGKNGGSAAFELKLAGAPATTNSPPRRRSRPNRRSRSPAPRALPPRRRASPTTPATPTATRSGSTGRRTRAAR